MNIAAICLHQVQYHILYMILAILHIMVLMDI